MVDDEPVKMLKDAKKEALLLEEKQSNLIDKLIEKSN